MTDEKAREVLGDVRAYLASRASLENEMLAGHTFIDICNAINVLEQQQKIGEWIVIGYDYKCKNCNAEINGEINYMSKSKIKYCPYCGIKLEVDGND